MIFEALKPLGRGLVHHVHPQGAPGRHVAYQNTADPKWYRVQAERLDQAARLDVTLILEPNPLSLQVEPPPE